MIDEIVGANEAIDTNEADDTNKAIDTEEAKAGDADEANEVVMLSPFSLTKYSVFFAEEVKGYFGINNNQLGAHLAEMI